MNTTISFVILLGVLIFVHEFGHFITAKIFNIKVLKFSLGFGPKILGMVRGETEYIISALPLGGYVKMLGEQPGEPISEADKARSFSHNPIWKRFLVVLFGPLFNLIFAILVFFLIYSFAGLPTAVEGTKIGIITPGSPAQMMGVKVNDIIMEVDGQETSTWLDVAKIISKSAGHEIHLTLKRDGRTLKLNGFPEEQEVKDIFGETTGKRYLLGITKSDEITFQKVTLFEAFKAGLNQTWAYIYLTIMGVVKIFQNIIPASELGGPILIANMAGQQFEAGWVNFFSFMAILSINLGIINLFPIPILDGGHLFFFIAEALRRKPLAEQTQEFFQKIGMVMLGSLMLFVFYNDFVRLLS